MTWVASQVTKCAKTCTYFLGSINHQMLERIFLSMSILTPYNHPPAHSNNYHSVASTRKRSQSLFLPSYHSISRCMKSIYLTRLPHNSPSSCSTPIPDVPLKRRLQKSRNQNLLLPPFPCKNSLSITTQNHKQRLPST